MTIIQMSDLNDDRFGRFGNQLFKYFFLKILEKELDVEIRHPNWLGNVAFDIKETKLIENECKVLIFDPADNWSLNKTVNEIKNYLKFEVLDIKGFFQFHSSEYLPYTNILKNTFKINHLLTQTVTQAIKRFQSNGSSIVSIHIRLGDYQNYQNNPVFWTTSFDSIFNSLEHLNSSVFLNKMIYLASDNISLCRKEFDSAKIKYITADDLFLLEDQNARLLVDFTIFSIANVNIISNSSLSFFGSLINNDSNIFLRPLPDVNFLAPFSPWNSAVLLKKNI
jgi:hypothetical protein